MASTTTILCVTLPPINLRRSATCRPSIWDSGLWIVLHFHSVKIMPCRSLCSICARKVHWRQSYVVKSVVHSSEVTNPLLSVFSSGLGSTHAFLARDDWSCETLSTRLRVLKFRSLCDGTESRKRGKL